MSKPDRRSFLLASAIILGLLAPACDSGEKPYGDGVALEEKGQFVEAATQYDTVCRRAPDSRFCVPSIARAATARLEAADESVRLFKFDEAEDLLHTVDESGDSAGKEKAEARLRSLDLVAGVRWAAASRNPDRRAALHAMEEIAATNTPAGGKANEWLQTNRAPILLDIARDACTGAGTPLCPSTCSRLLALSPAAPEVEQAKTLLAAFQAGEERRRYPMLVRAEKIMEECAGIWARNHAHQQCIMRQFAIDSDNVFGALAACGDDTKDVQRSEELRDQWRKLMDSLGSQEIVDRMEPRRAAACDQGSYVKQLPPKPPPSSGPGP